MRIPKSLLYTFLVSLLGSAFFSFSLAEYTVQLDLNDKKVYLISGTAKISVDNVDQYFSGGVSTGILAEETETKIITGGDNPFSGNQPNFGPNVLKELESWTEFDKALYRMYENGLTMYSTSTTYRPYDLLTREESAKIVGQLFEVLGFEKEERGFSCDFTDSQQFDPTLSAYIQNVCRRGIFRGNDKTQEYMPHDNLTKGQVFAVLIRIIEGTLSNESNTPWRMEYYVKARVLQLTQETNLLNIEAPITRYEMALLIYRFKNLIVGTNGESRLIEVLRTIYVAVQDNPLEYAALIDVLLREWNKLMGISGNASNSDNAGSDGSSGSNSNGSGSDSSGSNGSGSDTSNGSSGSTSDGMDLDLLAGNLSLADDPEFNEAIQWMYDVQITNYNTPDSYLPFQKITREQVAKMIDKFAIATQLTAIRNPAPCTFADVASGSEFKTAIINVCQYGVMVGDGNKFSPTEIVSKAEFIVALIRLVEGKTLDESQSPRWTAYYKKAIELSLISAQDTVSFPNPISRYEVAIFLYRMKVRLAMYNNLNEDKLNDEIIRTLEDTTLDGAEKKSGKIAVDLVSLNNRDFTNGYVEIFGQRYGVKKSILTNYNVGANSFVWYGDLIDIQTDEYVGTMTIVITNGALTEGVIRLSSSKVSYYISKNPLTTAYYHVEQG